MWPGAMQLGKFFLEQVCRFSPRLDEETAVTGALQLCLP
jgi:hypothetical protein